MIYTNAFYNLNWKRYFYYF